MDDIEQRSHIEAECRRRLIAFLLQASEGSMTAEAASAQVETALQGAEFQNSLDTYLARKAGKIH